MELLQLSAAGDAEAFSELMRRLTARVYRFALATLGDATEAEDVTQETFIEAYTCAARFDGRVAVLPWLLGIAHNRCRTNERRRRRGAISLDRLAESLESGTGDARLSVPPDSDQHELTWDVQRAARGLPMKYRAPLILRFQEGLTCAEIGEALGIPANTVAVRLHRARALLRQRLGDLNEILGDQTT